MVYDTAMVKDKVVHSRLQETDFEYLRKLAEKQRTTISKLLRQKIRAWRKEDK